MFIPVVGQEVTITRSNRNWGSDMDAFVGKKYIVSRVIESDHMGESIHEVFFDSEDPDLHSWSWIPEHGHMTFERKVIKVKLCINQK